MSDPCNVGARSIPHRLVDDELLLSISEVVGRYAFHGHNGHEQGQDVKGDADPPERVEVEDQQIEHEEVGGEGHEGVHGPRQPALRGQDGEGGPEDHQEDEIELGRDADVSTAQGSVDERDQGGGAPQEDHGPDLREHGPDLERSDEGGDDIGEKERERHRASAVPAAIGLGNGCWLVTLA